MTRLLLVAPNWLGDAVMALPAIADVRRASPDARITVVAKPAVAALFGMVRDVDEVLEKGAVPLFRDAGRKKEYAPLYDAALLLPNSFRSAFDAVRAGIPERWGFRGDGRRLLLTRAVRPPPSGTHQVDCYQHLVGALGFPNDRREPRLDVPPDVRTAGARALVEGGWDGATPLVALAPGAAFGGAKRWPPEYFAELVRGLAADGVRSVLVGSAADEPTARDILMALGSERSSPLNLLGTSVPVLAGLLTSVRALVTNDSGAMHLGAAVGVPVTAVFGPTDERLTAPRSGSAHAVLTHTVWCRPCMLRECPLDHQCMRGVSVDAVANATRRML
jgi:lipopolysaccharide heptosyltransferase II